MKLHPPTDPGKVFDDISVLAIKVVKTTGAAPAVANYNGVTAPISGECGARDGYSLFAQIIASPEYQGLYQTNLRLFELIDHLKAPDRPAERCYDVEVDALNLERWKWKAALQYRFFPDAPLTEQKLGYGAAAETPLSIT